MFANTKIDEIKVLQNNYETFIHRSFYDKNFKGSKTDFIKISLIWKK